MRSCLSFLVVELMRGGLDPTRACEEGIQRLKRIVNRSPGQGNMHSALTVGVVALSADGTVGAASTLGKANAHRGREGFPVVYWSEGDAQNMVLVSQDR
jgi:isoaspartyl peptidase/L-asparaginase-like protein (Ntn-hydrolase superfamily)